MLTRWIALAATLLLALGCSKPGPLQMPEAPPSRPTEQGWQAEPPSSQPAPAPAPRSAAGSYEDRSAGGDYDEALAPEAEERAARSRPGLATRWGEHRHSPSRSVHFSRAQDAPFDVAQLFYNDRNGARRMARGGSASQSTVQLGGGAVSVSIVDRYGSPLGGIYDGRVIAIGYPGDAYALSIRNNTGQRFEIVATVDGLDVIDGEDGDTTKPGYLLAPWQTLLIEGFRQSQNSVAQFRFGSVGESYAASKGKSRNVGVIGVAMFTEEGTGYPYTRYDDTDLRNTAEPFPRQYAQPPPRWYR